ncbi:carboxymuconolactone decarboxylase family protein [uncultured Bacteroides sp.]|uniref:cupin domain-containing carboxymuconolactone decarboxylase family protein n=1 Tax=uncultured Bacteroides sp. TaxID=162156 RepID=UPI002AAB088D|nr:carboxymuconolactone decarboxylase family protein [uncultured Bacteroides sp.]
MKNLVTILMVAVISFFNQNNQLNAQNMKEEIPKISNFPVGDKLPEMYSKYFIGQAYLASLTKNKDLNCPIANVTFEPGCRNNWHSHTGGQILVVIAGKGYYQAKGEPARLLLPGDVVEIPANVVHWHGAAPDSWFSHLAIETNPQNSKNTWLEAVDDEQYKKATTASGSKEINLTNAAIKNHEELWPGYQSKAKQTDPELIEIFDNFAFDEVIKYGNLDTKTRVMMIMGSTIAQGALTEYKMFVNGALNVGVTPVEIKEILYQSVAYVGVAKVIDFIYAANEILKERGIELPVKGQSTTTPETRMEKGLALQKDIFGEMIDKMYEQSPKNQLHIQKYLSANCFGDYQTRTGLDAKTRELLTFSMLISMGGTESQVKGHILGNVKVGNDKETLLSVTTQLLPYIGYPRTLNALKCLNEVIPE